MDSNNFYSDKKSLINNKSKTTSQTQNSEAAAINTIPKYLSKMFFPIFIVIFSITFLFSNEVSALTAWEALGIWKE